MKESKSLGNNERLVKDDEYSKTVVEQVVIDIVQSSTEREVTHVLQTRDHIVSSQPGCSRDVKLQTVPSKIKCNGLVSNNMETLDSTPRTSHECQNHSHIFENHSGIEIQKDNNLQTSTCSVIAPNLFSGIEAIQGPNSCNASTNTTEFRPTTSRGITVINLPNSNLQLTRALPHPPPTERGPPPSYSKSLLDRRINPCASIQFVAPIPPPSYDGMDNELRYAGRSGFTLGVGNTWQTQPQPAFCPVCETVVITKTEIHISRIAHVTALIMCLFLCWPFCLLPYLLNIINYTYHFCSICNWYLGTRRPFQS